MCMDEIEAWGTRPLLACTRNAEVDINYYKCSKTYHHAYQPINSIYFRLPRDARSRKKPSKTTGWYTILPSLPRGLCYRDKDTSGTSRDYGAAYQASTWRNASVDTFVQPPLQNQGYRKKQDSNMLYQRNYCYAVSLATYRRMNRRMCRFGYWWV